MITLEELKERIAQHYDPDLVVEVLEITTEELVELFEENVIKYRHRFSDLEDNRNETEESAS